MPTPQIPFPVDQIATFCQKWKITELAVFGSVLRDDFRPESDVDFLVSFANDAHWSLYTRLGKLLALLEQYFGQFWLRGSRMSPPDLRLCYPTQPRREKPQGHSVFGGWLTGHVGGAIKRFDPPEGHQHVTPADEPKRFFLELQRWYHNRVH
jgi:predicted nucleotidyltransferase